MTVIAYDHKNKTVSVDSRAASGDIDCGRVTKFAHLPNGGIAMGCGEWAAVSRILRALASGNTPEESDFSEVCIVTAVNGKVTQQDGSSFKEPVSRSWAWGSGREVALGALSAGATSAEAALYSCKYNLSCGGPVHTFSTR